MYSVKPLAYNILNQYYFCNLKQNGRLVDAFFTKATPVDSSCRTVVTLKKCKMNLYNMWVTLVFGTDHDILHKKCIIEGNQLTFQKAKEIDALKRPTHPA